MPTRIYRNSHRNNNITNDVGHSEWLMRVGIGNPTVTWSRGEAKLTAAPTSSFFKTGSLQDEGGLGNLTTVTSDCPPSLSELTFLQPWSCSGSAQHKSKPPTLTRLKTIGYHILLKPSLNLTLDLHQHYHIMTLLAVPKWVSVYLILRPLGLNSANPSWLITGFMSSYLPVHGYWG